MLTKQWETQVLTLELKKTTVLPYVKESRSPSDSRFQPVNSGFRIVDPGPRVGDSGFQTHKFRRNVSWIPSKFVDSGFHTMDSGSQILTFSGFPILDSFTTDDLSIFTV